MFSANRLKVSTNHRELFGGGVGVSCLEHYCIKLVAFSHINERKRIQIRPSTSKPGMDFMDTKAVVKWSLYIGTNRMIQQYLANVMISIK